ncbi:hypothetical protein MFERI14822_00785 [Mycoplasma feriruminatoris]|uniref:Type I restriction modification DNA specificity domain-containing protein n=2 Tax=Mycoplasma feriruminatoris TaxID=1179777 RepID=A0AAX3THA8_9MOLU|nr:hypothetical protein MFERI14822_00785 [Mycoplasma feriruminatoris]
MNNTMANIELIITSNLVEQSKISSLFSNLDSLITLHQRECNFWNLKKFEIKIHRFFTRFCRKSKKYTHTWEQEKLGKLVFYKTSSIILNNLNNNGKYCVYDANGIAGKIDIEPVSEEYISIIKDGAGAGRVRLLPKNTHILSTMGAILPLNTTDIKFVYFLLSKNSHLMKEASGSTIPHIYFKNYSQNIYIVPCNKEQYKISSLFSNLDSLITLHQRECNFWNLKKFEIKIHRFFTRFCRKPKKYTHTWEQEKLGDLTLLNRFPQISAEKLSELNQYKGDVSLLPSSNNNNWRCSYNEKISHLINYAEVITLGRARNPNPKYAKGLFISSQNHIIESKKNDILLNKFLYFFINKVGRKFYSFENTYPMFTKIDFLNTEFLFPSVKEQEKILKVLNNLDSLITLHQRECNFWNLKKFEIKIHRFFTRFCRKSKKYTHTWEQEKLGNLIRSVNINMCEVAFPTGKFEVIQQGSEPILGYVSNVKQLPYFDYDSVILFGDHTLSLYKPKKPFFVASDGVKAYIPTYLNSYYLYYLIQKNMPSSNGYKRHSSILKAKDILLSSNILEQKKLIFLFSNLDSLITLHQRGYKWRENIWKKMIYCYTNTFKIE